MRDKDTLHRLEHRRLPEDWRVKPPNIDEIPEGVFIIQCDSAHKKGIVGISTLIKTSRKEYKPIEYSARTKGPVHAELTAIYKGLVRINSIRRPIRRCIIYTDCLYAYYFLTKIWSAKRSYIEKIMNKIRNEIINLHEKETQVYICRTKSKYNKRVDKRAYRKRKREEAKKMRQILERVEKVEKAIIRSREIEILEVNDGYFAMPKEGSFLPGFRVRLDPPSCECPWWKHNWGNKAEYIVRARALPCKHICALAEYLGKDIYQIFNHQIGRVD